MTDTGRTGKEISGRGGDGSLTPSARHVMPNSKRGVSAQPASDVRLSQAGRACVALSQPRFPDEATRLPFNDVGWLDFTEVVTGS